MGRSQGKIRKANAADANAILAVRKEAILAGCKYVYSEQQLRVWTSLKASNKFTQDVADTFYVLELEQQIVATGKLNIENGQIDGIFVLPDYFGYGFSRQVLTFLESLAQQSGLTKLVLNATLNAVHAYRAFGFSGEKETQYSSPTGAMLTCVPMVKEIR